MVIDELFSCPISGTDILRAGGNADNANDANNTDYPDDTDNTGHTNYTNRREAKVWRDTYHWHSRRYLGLGC